MSHSEVIDDRPTPHRILVVDDEPTIRAVLQRFLEKKGYQAVTATSRQQAERLLKSDRFDAAVFDHELGDGNAIELLDTIQGEDVDVPVIVLTSNGTIDLAVQSIQHGAENFLTKPVDLVTFGVILSRVLENHRNRRQQSIHQARYTGPDPFVGTSRAIQELRAVAHKLASSDSPILIHGETGIGKGVLARWLHDHGQRAQEAFVDINCASLSPEFLDSELFGHQRGAFTGAATSKSGLLEVGDRGTVFLDEIGDVDQRVQPKLLKVLEEKRFRRMGEVRERAVDVRLVAASHHDLRQLVQNRLFREDLYFRINTLPLHIPPLRERPEDIRQLADRILGTLCHELGRPQATFSTEAIAAMERYPWPGNIRELRNVVERALLLAATDTIEPNDLRFERSLGPTEGLTLADVERRHIERVLEHVQQSVSPAARILGISRSTLYQKIKAHGIELSKS